MAAIDPPPPTNLTTTAAPRQSTLVVSDAPAAIARLALGARLEGVVLTEGGRGTVQVRTAFGTLTVNANVPLAKGASVLLILRASGPRPQFQIVTIDGAPPGSVRPSAAVPTALPTGGTLIGTPGAATPGAPPAVPSTPVTLALGSTLQVTVLRPAAIPGAPVAPVTPVTQGRAPQGVPGAPQGVPGAPIPMAPGPPAATPAAAAPASLPSGRAAAPQGAEAPSATLQAAPASLRATSAPGPLDPLGPLGPRGPQGPQGMRRRP